MAALKRDVFEALAHEPERLGLSPDMPTFWRVVDASPRLQARLTCIGQRAIDRLSDELLAEGMVGGDPALARTVAQLAAAVPWSLQAEIRRRLSAGESVATITAALPPIAEQAFALLERGLGALGAVR